MSHSETMVVVGSIMLPFAIFMLCAGLGELWERGWFR